MTQKELLKLSRKQLLEIMLAQAKEIDRLNELVDELRQKLQEKQYSEIGSLAETALEITKVFGDAQAAADVYLQEIEHLKADSQQEHEQIIAAAKKEADEMLAEARSWCSQRISETNENITKANKEIEAYFKAHPEIVEHQS